jgi:hypothetical protein
VGYSEYSDVIQFLSQYWLVIWLLRISIYGNLKTFLGLDKSIIIDSSTAAPIQWFSCLNTKYVVIDLTSVS